MDGFRTLADWVFYGSGLADGEAVNGIIGYEFDQVFQSGAGDIATGQPIPLATPSSLQILATSNFSNDSAGTQTANSTRLPRRQVEHTRVLGRDVRLELGLTGDGRDASGDVGR